MDQETMVELEDSIVREIAGLVDSAILRIMNAPMERDEALALVA